jgi:AraC-like DNA-binding protein/quercetin dioxygenase-like cupin family protein
MDVLPVERPLPSQGGVLRRWSAPRGFVGPSNAHPGLEIAWCEQGRADYTIAGRHFVVEPGEAMVVPANIEHVTEIKPGTSARSIHLPTATVVAVEDAICLELREPVVVPGGAGRPSALTTLGSLLSREVDGEREGKALAIEALTDAVLVEALRAGRPSNEVGAGPQPEGGGRPKDGRVRRAVEMIHAHYSEPIGIDELAKAAGMSRFHFSRLFRAQTGKSPYRYLLDFRMRRAAHLLRSRHCGVTQAAYSVGCSDLGRFGRMFRDAHGVRPSEYARA